MKMVSFVLGARVMSLSGTSGLRELPESQGRPDAHLGSRTTPTDSGLLTQGRYYTSASRLCPSLQLRGTTQVLLLWDRLAYA